MWSVKRIGLVLFLVVYALVGANAHAAIEVGEKLPDLSDFGLEGEIPDLDGKVVLVDVWASWCAPCKASFPAFDALHRSQEREGLVILAVSVDRKESAYQKFLQRMEPVFATVRDGQQKLVAELSPPAMPTSYIFGRDGRLRSVHKGFHGERTVDELTAEISTLLKEDA